MSNESEAVQDFIKPAKKGEKVKTKKKSVKRKPKKKADTTKFVVVSFKVPETWLTKQILNRLN